jgi:aspartate dehydrogenase
VVLIGWGAMARATAEMLDDGLVELVGVGIRPGSGPVPDLPSGTQLITDPAELSATRPDVVAEAASRESVLPWGLAALDAGIDFIVSSTSAFADSEVLDALRIAATSAGAQLQIQPGALGGVDALSAARGMGLDTVEHRVTKPPLAWRGTPAERMCDLAALTEPEAFFSDSAAEAASQFPKNANVAMTTALAGVGPAKTKITLVADPHATTNQHEITASGGFGQLNVVISNKALPGNPKTSAMAALNLVRCIENRSSSIVI